jgi:hypothetical protein
MTEERRILTAGEQEVVDVIFRADKQLSAAISQALETATQQALEEMSRIGQEQAAPAMQYFASVVHQRMYCLMCGADPDTLRGGDPDIAYHVIRNSQGIAKEYWSADIELYPAK